MEEKTPFRNENHPELESDETFLENMNKYEFQACSYQSKRAGKEAYDFAGAKVEGMFPVFVSIAEWNKKMGS